MNGLSIYRDTVEGMKYDERYHIGRDARYNGRYKIFKKIPFEEFKKVLKKVFEIYEFNSILSLNEFYDAAERSVDKKMFETYMIVSFDLG